MSPLRKCRPERRDEVLRIVLAIDAIALLAACDAPRETGDGRADTTSAAASAAAPVAATVAATAPDLAACPKRQLLEEGLRERTKPIPVPAALREIMRSDIDNFAFSTFDGSTVCVDASWMEAIREPGISADKRFVSFGWDGYEAFGYAIVDRVGSGQEIDTGVAPVRSPSGKRMAALDYSESGYGALNAFAVWDIAPERLVQIARIETLPEMYGWRLDRWRGEACLELSAISWEDFAEQGEQDKAPRQGFVARPVSGGWQVLPTSDDRCPQA